MDYELLRKLYDIGSFKGYSDDEIREMSEGFDMIPATLIDFWKTCGNNKELYANSNDYWIDPEFYRKSNWLKNAPKDYYYLLDENQHCYQAAIRREDMHLPDPPVYIVEPLHGEETREVGPANECLSAFLMGMLLYEAALSAGPFKYFYEDYIWYGENDIAKIESLLHKYPYHVYNWYSERIDVYTMNEEALLFVMQGDEPNGTYAAKTEEALQRMKGLLGGIGV